MASFTQSFKNTGYMQSSLNILLFFMSWGIWWSFFQLWLKKEAESGGLGFTNTQVGTLYSVNSIATLILMFIYGTMQDRIGYKRTLQVFIVAISALVGPFMIYVYEPLLRSNYMVGVVVGAVVLSAGFMAGVGLLEALAERFSRRYNFEYGQARVGLLRLRHCGPRCRLPLHYQPPLQLLGRLCTRTYQLVDRSSVEGSGPRSRS